MNKAEVFVGKQTGIWLPLENKKDFLRVGAVPKKLYAVYVGDRQLGFRHVYRQ